MKAKLVIDVEKKLMKTAKPNLSLNIIINILALTTSIYSLYLASHAGHWVHFLMAVIVFSYTNNTLFALLHESVHRIYSSKGWVNECAGILNGAMFPTGLTFQRICHLGHHLRNRTDHEMFDMYYPDDNLFLKRAQFYSILTGIYWITIPLGWLIYLFIPWSYRLLKSENKAIKHTGAIMLHPFIDHPKKWRIRFELVFVIFFHIFLLKVFQLNFLSTFICYWVFGLVWGSLQYADHAWSPRDVLKGAWNLKTNPITRAFFLNYHFHQVHHMNPKLPWNHLPAHVESGSPSPSFWKIYLEMWKGPRPASAAAPKPVQEVMDELSDDEDLLLQKSKSCEWICFKQFIHFSRRNLRYAGIAIVLYLYSFKNWKIAKRLRHGFATLQLIDDLLDGDRPSKREPLEIVDELVTAFQNRAFNHSELQQLMECYCSQFKDENTKELELLLLKVIKAMRFDRVRVKDKLLLTSGELQKQFEDTFSSSLDLLLLTSGSSLRTQDLPEVIDLFMWSSIIRDLEEDIDKGLVNIPKEYWDGHLSSRLVQGWLHSQRVIKKDQYQLAIEKLKQLEEPTGRKIFNIFIRSMKKYLAEESIDALG
jgi:fatty acid desaturase